MRRREFITLAGGAAVAWPLAASAQQERVRRIGIMLSGAENDPEMQARVNALRQGLQALGWIEGRNYHFEYRWPESDAERVKTDTAQLIALAPDVIVAGSQLGVMALLQETRSIPIVFVNLADPVGNGLVRSLANTGRNITGFTAFEFATAGKWLELLKEIAPRIRRVAVIFGARTTGEGFYRALETVALSSPIELTPLRLNNPADVESVIDAFAARPDGGLIAAAEAGAVINRAAIIRFAARHRLPAVYPFRFFATDGGLAVYGVDLMDQYRRSAAYVDRILKGANPATLPVQAPDKFELIINLKTAKAQGIEIPPLLLTRADEVIE